MSAGCPPPASQNTERSGAAGGPVLVGGGNGWYRRPETGNDRTSLAAARSPGRYESPAGPAMETPARTGTPRSGEPSEFQPIFCARVVRVVPQP
jgi:hypothetical protein